MSGWRYAAPMQKIAAGAPQVVASYAALLISEDQAPNPPARRVITRLSAGRFAQQQRRPYGLGAVHQDKSTGEFLSPHAEPGMARVRCGCRRGGAGDRQ